MVLIDEEDEQIKQAIAQSLESSQEETRRRQGREVQRHVRSTLEGEGEGEGRGGEDDDDAEAQFQRDLAVAIEASKASSSMSPPISVSVSTSQPRQEDHTRGNASQLPTDANKAQQEGDRGTQAEAEAEAGETQRPAFLKERAKMEKERLERLERQKRMREEGQGECISIAGLSAGSTSGNVNVNAVTPPTKKQRTSPPPLRPRTSAKAGASQRPSSSANTSISSTSGKKKNGKLPARNGNNDTSEEKYDLFWDGELRQIANRLVDKDKDVRPTFRLSEIIGPKSEVTLAILSSYANSMDWLYGFFEPSTPIVVVNQPSEEGNREVKELAPNMLMTKPFIRNGRGCMHIKIMLLFYKGGRLRVVVPTANLTEYDWRDIENTAWVQDIPMRQTTIRHDPNAADFSGTLQRVLHSLNVPVALTKFLDSDDWDLPIEALSELRMRWDWSRVKVKLVTSIAGKHDGWEQVVRTGHPAFMKAIQELGAQPPKGKQLVLECQGSSIGTYSTQWMNEFYCSARGESAKIWLDRPRNQRMKLPWPPVKILFPSLQTVKESVLGMPGGGTMFCRKAQWEGKNFPRELFYDSNSKRGRVLMHSKMIVGTFREKPGAFSSGARRDGDGRRKPGEDELTAGEEEEDVLIIDSSNNEKEKGGKGEERDTTKTQEKLIGWAYVGSHNFTPSAWGTLSSSASSPSLNIVNYELGIVIPLRTYEELEDVACWKRPARKYVEGIDRPWMQEEMREGFAIM